MENSSYVKGSPLKILRDNNRSFKEMLRKRNKRIKNKKYLRDEIYSNHNVFQSKINLYRNMTAQNIIWDKNYNYKVSINGLKEENCSLKSRIWNM